MATHQQQKPLLLHNHHQNKKSLLLIFDGVVASTVFIASYLIIRTTSFSSFSLSSSSSSPHHHDDLYQHAIHRATCLAHVSEIAQQDPILATTKGHNFNLLQSFLTKSNSGIQEAMDMASAIKIRFNGSPKEEAALQVCADLMDLSIGRVLQSVVALTKRNTTHSLQDAHTWQSSVLTNHATCLDGLEGFSARAIMEPQLRDLIFRSRTSLAVLAALLPPLDSENQQLLEEPQNGDIPTWVTRNDMRLLESVAADIKANVVVAKDGSGNKFKTMAEAVASAPDNSKTRYVIYVKKQGTYKENVEIGKKKKNVMLVGDSMDKTIITGSLNYVDGTPTFQTATIAAVGDGFIGQDIWFQNTAGPEKHQVVALRVGADTSVINRCCIDAYQDTLYCKLVTRKPLTKQKNIVTAQRRVDPNQNTGTSIKQCKVTPSSDLKPVVKTFWVVPGRSIQEQW
ncbi:hypothetical protein AHAS_Ahas05G0102600 [Arachis hypogaea]